MRRTFKMRQTWENNNKLKESRFYYNLFKDKELTDLYEELKNAIGADNLCDEIATSIDREELKKILNHLSELYFRR